MIAPFQGSFNPARVLFGPGELRRVADEIAVLGVNSALVLSTSRQRADAEALARTLGSAAAGVFAEAAMHTPVEVTERALSVFNECGADCVVALGGGSTIGLGKAIAYRNDCPQITVATTYAGSEVTPILGQTENGRKTTVRAASVLPEVVIYDPELTRDLPVSMSVTSGLNAIAHSVEALYARDSNPVTSMMAVEGIRALRDALPVIVESPDGRRRARERPLRVMALRYRPWHRGNVAAPQALPHAGRFVRHASCRDTLRADPAHGGLQRGRRDAGAGTGGRPVRRASRGRALGLRERSRRAAVPAGAGPVGRRPRRGRRHRRAERLLEPPSDRARGHSRTCCRAHGSEHAPD